MGSQEFLNICATSGNTGGCEGSLQQHSNKYNQLIFWHHAPSFRQ